MLKNTRKVCIYQLNEYLYNMNAKRGGKQEKTDVFEGGIVCPDAKSKRLPCLKKEWTVFNGQITPC